MKVQNGRGIVIELGEMIKSGGEAKIRLVKDQPALVAKVYHAHRAEREAKLKAMLAKVPVQPATHTALAWPTQLLYEKGQLVGFLMPKIDGYDPIFNFYNPARRKKLAPDAGLRYLHRVASNLAVVVESVYLAGHVVGDLNESNVLVNDRALVTLVDTDSFQIQDAKGLIYPCPVGKPEYTAPELQGVSFQKIHRRPEHDHFALAVLIFQLLMQGYHPFYAVLPDHMFVERSDVMGIKEGLFPYYQNRRHNQQPSIKIPPHAPPFRHLHPDLQALFIRCFVDGHHNPTLRPTAGEWRIQLEKAEEALVMCERDHLYSTHLGSCPVCPPERAIQKPLLSVVENALPSNRSALPQSLSSPAPSQAVSMQSPEPPNKSPSVMKLLWNAILIATVAITWLTLPSLGISPQSEAIVDPPASVAVVEAVATDTKTASSQSQASKTVVEQTKTTTIEKTATASSRLAGEIACFGTFDLGITCLDESGWTSFSEDDSSLGGNLISGMTVCPDSDNRLLIAHSSGISAFDGQTWAEYEDEWGSGSVDAIACEANGGIWVAHYKGVSYFDGENWTTTSSKQLATGDDATDLVEDVAIAPDGQVWVATAHTIATTLDGKTWTVYQQGQGFDEQYFLESVAVDHLGEVWAASSSGLLHFDGTNWIEHENSDFIIPETLIVDDDRNLWLGTFGDGLMRFNGQNWVTYNTQNSGLMSNYVRSLAIDAQGRVWVATSWGLSVFDGNKWITYQMDNADLVDNDIDALAVIGDGPALPEAKDKENGQLSGQLLNFDEEPLVDATVEVCVESFSFYTSPSRCKEEPLTLQTTTDADGNFSITDIPVGRYVISASPGKGKWAQLENYSSFGIGSERVLIHAGKETDLSILILQEKDAKLHLKKSEK